MSNYDNGYDAAARDYENQTPYDNDKVIGGNEDV